MHSVARILIWNTANFILLKTLNDHLFHSSNLADDIVHSRFHFRTKLIGVNLHVSAGITAKFVGDEFFIQVLHSVWSDNNWEDVESVAMGKVTNTFRVGITSWLVIQSIAIPFFIHNGNNDLSSLLARFSWSSTGHMIVQITQSQILKEQVELTITIKCLKSYSNECSLNLPNSPTIIFKDNDLSFFRTIKIFNIESTDYLYTIYTVFLSTYIEKDWPVYLYSVLHYLGNLQTISLMDESGILVDGPYSTFQCFNPGVPVSPLLPGLYLPSNCLIPENWMTRKHLYPFFHFSRSYQSRSNEHFPKLIEVVASSILACFQE